MSLFNVNDIESTDMFVFVIINGSKHVQTWVKSWSRFYKVVQLHKPC